MSDMLRIFVAVLLLTLSLAAYFLVIHALFAQRAAKTKAAFQSMPGRSLGIGLVNFAFFAVIAMVLISISNKLENGFFKGVLMLPALVIIAILAVMLSVGLAAMSRHVGETIGPDLTAWKQDMWGTVCLCFGCALPFVGWFLLLPYLGFVGIGAFILGLFQREPKV